MFHSDENLFLIRTKLYRPRVASDLVPRPHLRGRLLERIDRPFTLVSAPAGFGKTTISTARRHAVTIYQKLGVNNRKQALSAAIAAGVLPDPVRQEM